MKATQTGFSILEVILAAAIFVTIALGGTIVIISALNTNKSGIEEAVANQLATEGIEAARSIKNNSFSQLTNYSQTGLQQIGGVWTLKGSGTSDTFDIYNRSLSISTAERDCTGNIVPTGTPDIHTKRVLSTVSWDASPTRHNQTILTTYFTDWKEPKTPGGMLVYSDGGTTSDAVKYRVLDGATGTWGAVTALPDFDTSATNKALRSIRTFASPTRNEKISISRHYNGSSQFIYAHVYNGSTWTSAQFSSWNATTFLDVRNFDGTYLANGNFMAVYSDNTSTPKYRMWNGCSWSAQSSLVNLATNGSGIPLYIVAKARPGTNEVMAAFFGQARDTNTQYYNGSTWSLHSRHANNGPAAKEMVDFAWNPNTPIKGALVYPESTTDRNITIKIWTANGSGGGSWSNAVNASNQGTLGAITIDGRLGADEFLSCDKDGNNDIYCFRSTFTPSWTTPTNNILTTTTNTGIQRSYDFSFEAATGTNGLVVYSDNTTTPKFRIYTPGSSPAFNAAASLTTAFTTSVNTVRLRPLSISDDIMILMGDGGNDLYTIVWNGTSNTVYTTPAGKARTQQGINGSSTTDFWYDFAWDQY